MHATNYATFSFSDDILIINVKPIIYISISTKSKRRIKNIVFLRIISMSAVEGYSLVVSLHIIITVNSEVDNITPMIAIIF